MLALLYGTDCKNGKHSRRAGNVLGCKQLYLGLAIVTFSLIWGAYKARGFVRQRKCPQKFAWIFLNYSNF